MIRKMLKSGKCPICGGHARIVNGVYVCDNCKIVFSEFGISHVAKNIIDNFGLEPEFDIFGHPSEELIKENLN